MIWATFLILCYPFVLCISAIILYFSLRYAPQFSGFFCSHISHSIYLLSINKKCAAQTEPRTKNAQLRLLPHKLLAHSRECQTGECVFTKVKNTFSGHVHIIQFVWHPHLTIPPHQAQFPICRISQLFQRLRGR